MFSEDDLRNIMTSKIMKNKDDPKNEDNPKMKNIQI